MRSKQLAATIPNQIITAMNKMLQLGMLDKQEAQIRITKDMPEMLMRAGDVYTVDKYALFLNHGLMVAMFKETNMAIFDIPIDNIEVL